MEKKELPEEHIRWIQYCAQLACLAMIRDEGIIDAEEHMHERSHRSLRCEQETYGTDCSPWREIAGEHLQDGSPCLHIQL